MSASGIAYGLAFFLGALVAAVELAARYRDRPVALFRLVGAWIYIALNALTSVAALAVTRAFGWSFGASTAETTSILQVLVAGVAGIALLRSSLFVARVGDRDVGVGPSIIIAELLGIIDKSIDRRRATDRAAHVTAIMRNVSFEKAYLPLPGFCLALLQNVSAEEQQSLGTAVDALRAQAMTDSQKAYTLGLLLMNLAGADVLSAAVKALSNEIRADVPAVDPAGQRPDAPAIVVRP